MSWKIKYWDYILRRKLKDEESWIIDYCLKLDMMGIWGVKGMFERSDHYGILMKRKTLTDENLKVKIFKNEGII